MSNNRPPLNYKLKDNPFFAKRNDAKPPLGNVNKTTVTQTETSKESNNSLGNRFPKPTTTTPEARKNVRASIQKMAASSNVSTNPWKSKMMANQGTTSKSSNSTTMTNSNSNVDNPIKNSASTTSSSQPTKLSKSTSSTLSKETKSDDTINKPDPNNNAENTQTTIMRRASRKKSSTMSTSNSIDSVQVQQPIKEENATTKVVVSDSITKKPSTMDDSTMNGKVTKKIAGDTKSNKQATMTTTTTAAQSPLRPTSSSTDFSRTSFNSFSGSGSITSSNDDGYHEEMFEQSSNIHSNKKRLTAFGAPLPWGEYVVMDNERKLEEGSILSDNTNAVDQLVASHAHITSAKFPTMSITDAENMRQRHERLKTSGEHIRHRIHVETDIQRSIASLLKLATHSRDDTLVDDMYSSTFDVDTMIDELHLVLSQACDCQTRYLQHLAGALAKDTLTQQQSNHGVTQKDITRLERMVKQYATESEYRGDDVQQMLDVLEKRLQQQHESNRVHDLQDALQRARRDRDHQIRLLEKELQQAKRREHDLLRKQQQQQLPSVSTGELDELKNTLEQAKEREKELQAQSTQMQDELMRAKEIERDLRAQMELPATQIQQLKDELSQREEKLHQMMNDKQQQGNDVTEEKVQRVQQQLDVSRKHEMELQKQLDDRVSLEHQISQALIATSCQSLDDMVHKIIDNNTTSSPPPPPPPLTDMEKAFKAAQEEYTRREAALMLQTASVEAELGAVLKEYDRVTRNITDFNHERKKYESQMETLIREKQLLDKQLADKQVQEGIGRDGQTMTLRKEFRQLMATVKAEHEQAMEKEVEQRRQIEVELRNIKHDLEMKNWDRVSTGVQTHFVAYPL
ncbi:hypothetical protein K492DRAFT_234427 [Lichtheimia hyalospora FSU 10163]|nr:hypothetical protein K492DRAFT_234427 [Lichtheimia hyalospora FSU 10163]